VTSIAQLLAHKCLKLTAKVEKNISKRTPTNVQRLSTCKFPKSSIVTKERELHAHEAVVHPLFAETTSVALQDKHDALQTHPRMLGSGWEEGTGVEALREQAVPIQALA